jgi:hypothetical protein
MLANSPEKHDATHLFDFIVLFPGLKGEVS